MPRLRQEVSGSIRADVAPEYFRNFFIEDGDHFRIIKNLPDDLIFPEYNIIIEDEWDFPYLQRICKGVSTRSAKEFDQENTCDPLRRQAEKNLPASTGMLSLINEPRLYQGKLEIQNKEPQSAQQEAAELRHKYEDFP